MIVLPHGSHGTIGGGRLEQIVIDQARKLIDAEGSTWRIQNYPLGPLLGQCCGGRVTLLVERITLADRRWLIAVAENMAAGRVFAIEHHFASDEVSRKLAQPMKAAKQPDWTNPGPIPVACWMEAFTAIPRVVVAGAGHVGSALISVLRGLELRLEWYDVRAEFVEKGADIVETNTLVAVFAEATAQDQLFVITHDHGLDYTLVAAGLSGAARCIGLIGSKTKRASFVARLRREGLSHAVGDRLVCPIGRLETRTKEPAAIAISVAAEILSRFDHK